MYAFLTYSFKASRHGKNSSERLVEVRIYGHTWTTPASTCQTLGSHINAHVAAVAGDDAMHQSCRKVI